MNLIKLQLTKSTHKIQSKIKLSLLTGDIILLFTKSQESTGWLLKLLNKFRKVSGYKVNNQKWILFLHIHIEQSQREISIANPFTKAPERINTYE